MKKLKLFSILLLGIPLLFGCQKQGNTSEQVYNDVLFDTIIQVKIYDPVDQSILSECESLCQKYDKLFSRTNPDSDVSRINQSKGNSVSVSPETIDLIKKGIEYGDLSKGAFDITIASVSSLWDFHEDSAKMPDKKSALEAISHIDYHNIVVDQHTITLLDPDASIDLGGIAKGYIADQIASYLKDNGVTHAIINLGGNVLTIGAKPDGSPFHIGIQKPFEPSGEPITSIDIQDKSVVTTGIYERYFKKNDVIYHHVLDPKTGFPCNNSLASVTIITDSSLDADALSTTCYLLGLEEGMKLIHSLENTEAVFITLDNEIIDSRN